MAEKKKIYLQPTPVRIWHWLNAFGIMTLIVSGAQIRFPEYIGILGSYKSAVYLHNTAGFVVAISFSLWFFYYMFISRTMADLYVPRAADLKTGLVKQAKFYFLTYFLAGITLIIQRLRINSIRCRNRFIWRSCSSWCHWLA